jgi:hypothetical protein
MGGSGMSTPRFKVGDMVITVDNGWVMPQVRGYLGRVGTILSWCNVTHLPLAGYCIDTIPVPVYESALRLIKDGDTQLDEKTERDLVRVK